MLELCGFVKDVVYAGNGFVALHAVTAGVKRLRLPTVCKTECLFGVENFDATDTQLTFELPQYGTVLFRLTAP